MAKKRKKEVAKKSDVPRGTYLQINNPCRKLVVLSSTNDIVRYMDFYNVNDQWRSYPSIANRIQWELDVEHGELIYEPV